MGCGVGKRSLSHQKTDLTLVGTGVLKYDTIFREMERPLHVIQKAQQKLANAIAAFQSSVGMSGGGQLVTFFDAVMGMLICFSASGGGSLDSISFAVVSQPPYITLDTSRLASEHRRIPECWTRLITLAHKTQTKLESLTPIITAAANDIAGVAEEASIMPQRANSVKNRVLSNHEKVTIAPSVMGEVLDQAYEVLQTAANIPDMITEASQVITFIGNKARTEHIMRPRDLVDSYWVLNSYAARYGKS